ncbi:hypothetical protein J14TS2_00690 [Bacillus sp. J14TS2]|nr:hypothetical protein J14TS2_00690 [Bacillus sp. J14TS2]
MITEKSSFILFHALLGSIKRPIYFLTLRVPECYGPVQIQQSLLYPLHVKNRDEK